MHIDGDGRSGGMRIDAIGVGEGDKPAVSAGDKRRKGRFWVPLVWAAAPTLLGILYCCASRYYGVPEPVFGLFFFAVVLPAAVICEKLGLGQFSILGGSTVPDWLFSGVMIVLVYLYSLVLVVLVRWVWCFVLQTKREM